MYIFNVLNPNTEENSHSLFRGMKNGTATLEDRLAESSISHKTKCSSTMQFSNLTYKHFPSWFESVVVTFHLLRCVWLFATPWTAACQASLFFTISQSLLKFMATESVMLSNHLILCCPLLLLPSVFPGIRVFSSQLALWIMASASSALVLPVNIQGWFPLRLTGLISF